MIHRQLVQVLRAEAQNDDDDDDDDDDGDEQIKAIRLGFLSRALSKDALSILYTMKAVGKLQACCY
jgi:hypothetical protein